MTLTDARLRRRPKGAGRWRTLTAAVARLDAGNVPDPPEWDADDDEDHHGRRGPIFTAPLERGYRGEEQEAPRDPALTLPPASVRYGSVKAAILAWFADHEQGRSSDIAAAVVRDFPTAGNIQNVRVHLVQMADRGHIRRVGLGVYARAA